MSKEAFEREKMYQATMGIAKKLLSDGIVSADDYRRIDGIFREKYRPIYGLAASGIR